MSFKRRANRYASIRPSQKTGIETPTLATAMVATSVLVL